MSDKENLNRLEIIIAHLDALIKFEVYKLKKSKPSIEKNYDTFLELLRVKNKLMDRSIRLLSKVYDTH